MDGEEFFDAVQNARIVHAAEHYYRIMYEGATDPGTCATGTCSRRCRACWRRRDNAKAVVWAHNSHIGNAAATEMGWQGEFNIGELCRKAYRERGGSRSASVRIAARWPPPTIGTSRWRSRMCVPPRPDSHERIFRDAGLGCFLTDLARERPGRADGRALLGPAWSAPSA